jgi:hypothetical protein
MTDHVVIPTSPPPPAGRTESRGTVDTRDGAGLTERESETVAQIAIGRDIRRRYPETLCVLADSHRAWPA